jgi:hypothetical protein
MLLSKTSVCVALICASLFVPKTALSQNNNNRAVSLAQMECSSLGDAGRYVPVNMNVTIGRQVFRSVAYLNGQRPGFMTGRTGVLTGEPAGIACSLASPTERPRFRTLTLAFGFADNGYELDYVGALPNTALRLSIYKNGNFYGSQTIRGGDAIRLPIDVANTRSIALEAECLRGGRSFTLYGNGSEECPVLYFFEDILE